MSKKPKKSNKAKKIPDPGAKATAVERADVAVAQAASEVRDAPLVKVIGALAEVGDQPPMLALSGLALAAGLWRRDRRLIRAGVRMLAAELVATAVKDVVKRSVSRTRPDMMIEEGRYEMKRGGPYEGKWNSFPSGHTAGAVAVSRALAREYPEARLPAYTAAATIAAAQVPACNHYPSDIGAGAAVGLLSEWLVDRGMRRVDRRLEPQLHGAALVRRETAARLVA
jgi:membrane-associated phospholipid phosphatase